MRRADCAMARDLPGSDVEMGRDPGGQPALVRPDPIGLRQQLDQLPVSGLFAAADCLGGFEE